MDCELSLKMVLGGSHAPRSGWFCKWNVVGGLGLGLPAFALAFFFFSSVSSVSVFNMEVKYELHNIQLNK